MAPRNKAAADARPPTTSNRPQQTRFPIDVPQEGSSRGAAAAALHPFDALCAGLLADRVSPSRRVQAGRCVSAVLVLLRSLQLVSVKASLRVPPVLSSYRITHGRASRE